MAKSSIQIENRKLALDQAKLDLESNIQRAFTDAKAALKTYVSAQKSVASRQISFKKKCSGTLQHWRAKCI